MDNDRNLIWEAYDQVNEMFRDEDHYAKEPARAAARDWWKNKFLKSLPKWPDGSGRSRDVDPPISDITAAVKQFIVASSGEEWFSPTIIANEIHSQIQETSWAEINTGLDKAAAVFRPLVRFIDSFPESSGHVGPQTPVAPVEQSSPRDRSRQEIERGQTPSRFGPTGDDARDYD